MDLFTGKKLWMPDMLADGIARGGDKTFAIYQHADGSRQNVSYNEISAEAFALLDRLKAAGLKKGDRLAVISALRPWWYSVLYAALMGGYRMVCIDPGVPSRQMQHMMRETEVRAVFTTMPNVRLPEGLDSRIPVFSVSAGFPLVSERADVDRLLPRASAMPQDTFFILFSSGTTGERRKCVLLPHTSVTKGIEGGMATDSGVYKNEPAYTPRKRDLMLFPPYHIAGLLCAVYDFYCNTEVIMLERLTPNALATVLGELKPDNVCTVPSMLTILMKKINAAVSKKTFARILVKILMGFSGFVRRKFGWKAGRKLLGFLNRQALGGNMDGFMIGGSPCDEETMRFFLDMGIDVSIAYGLTELGAPLAVTGKGYYPGTTGRVLRHDPEMDIRVVNPDEKGRGEVEVRSCLRMIRYLADEDMEGCFTGDNYFKTGDLGYFDEQNCLVICGRAKEAIVLRNGEKLLPEEIEKLYENINDVGELSVFRVPDGNCDTFCIAAVRDRAFSIPDDVVKLQILDRASTLPAMYRPREVYMLHELPVSSSHKVQRFRLTDMVVKGLSSPVSEACQRAVDDNETVAALRELLASVGGPRWNTIELTEGLPLDLDSLQSIELTVGIQDRFGMDLFQLAQAPETFGALVDAVTYFDESDKNNKSGLDLSQFPAPVTRSERVFFGGVGKFAKLLWHVRSKGQENLPSDCNFIICSNHITVLDPGWICSSMPKEIAEKTAIVGKSDLVDDKLLKNFVRSFNFVPVDRSGNSMLTLDRCRELLEEGWNVLIFPEGTNFENGTKLMPLKEGPARLAIATGKPIVPVHITGLGHVDMDKLNFLPPTAGSRVRICFGEPISTEGMDDPAEVNAVLADAIEALSY